MRGVIALSGGAVVTFFLFVFMASLVVMKPIAPGPSKPWFDPSDLPTRYEAPKPVEREKLPERKKVEVPPQTPSFGMNDLSKDNHSDIIVPPGNGELPKDWNHKLPGTVDILVPDVTGISSMSAETKSAMPLAQLPPQYPRVEATNGVEGWVRLRFVINANGEPINIAVIEAKPKSVFNKAAISAISKWRYRPALLEGKPVESSLQEVVLQFTLENN